MALPGVSPLEDPAPNSIVSWGGCARGGLRPGCAQRRAYARAPSSSQVEDSHTASRMAMPMQRGVEQEQGTIVPLIMGGTRLASSPSAGTALICLEIALLAACTGCRGAEHIGLRIRSARL